LFCVVLTSLVHSPLQKRTETLEGLVESLEEDKGSLTKQVAEQEALLRKIKTGFQKNEREQTRQANDEHEYALHMELRIKELETSAKRHQETDKKLRMEMQTLKDRNGLWGSHLLQSLDGIDRLLSLSPRCFVRHSQPGIPSTRGGRREI